VVGRGVLIDAARSKGKDSLDAGERITLDDMLAAAETELADREARIIIHTGWLKRLRQGRRGIFPRACSTKPGLGYSIELAKCFTNGDSVGRQRTRSPPSRPIMKRAARYPLHMALLHYQGVIFTRNRLDATSPRLRQDGQYTSCSWALRKGGRGAGSPVTDRNK